MLRMLSGICFLMMIRWQQAELQSVSDDEINKAFKEASAIMAQMQENDDEMEGIEPECGGNQTGGNVAYEHVLHRHMKAAKMQELLEETTRILKKNKNLTPDEVSALQKRDLRSALPKLIEKCSKAMNEIECDEKYPYRTMDGSCNNLQHSIWGKAYSCFSRLLHPAYSDGISDARKSVLGGDLPDIRSITLDLNPEKDDFLQNLSLIFMQYGQFLAHDISSAPIVANSIIGPQVDCCRESGNYYCSWGGINISSNDPFYKQFGVTCRNTARSTMCLTCRLGPRSHANGITSFIDGSIIYGSSKEQSDQLRSFDGKGTLRYSSDSDGGILLPPSSVCVDDQCSDQSETTRCFESGDIRINQQKMITAFQTLFLRQHNRVALELGSLNKHWDEETIFQETRKIIAAQIQMIGYKEFLPNVIGEDTMKIYDLFVKKDSSYTDYNAKINPSLLTEFATAAYRFGHSLIPKNILHVFNLHSYRERMKDIFSYPFDFYKNNYIEELITGMSLSSPQQFDRFLVEDLTNHLYQERGESFRHDIAARDVFRELDHGMPSYTDIVRYCLRKNITTFEDLRPLFRKNTVKYYRRVFKDVADIDFLNGAYSEEPIKGAVVGPTIACIVGIQFHNLKYGDRFYFEHGGQISSFTKEQLKEIKKTTLAKIICENSKVKWIQRDVMFKPSITNPTILCRLIPDLDLSIFKK